MMRELAGDKNNRVGFSKPAFLTLKQKALRVGLGVQRRGLLLVCVRAADVRAPRRFPTGPMPQPS